MTGSGSCRGDGPDRAQVGRDVLARAAIAARGPQDEDAVLVSQADRQAVDLELGHVGRSGLAVGQPEAATHPRVEGPQLVGIEGVGQRQHGNAMLDLPQRPAGDPAGRDDGVGR